MQNWTGQAYDYIIERFRRSIQGQGRKLKGWTGKTYDYLVRNLGSLTIIQRWTEYKKWTDLSQSLFI